MFASSTLGWKDGLFLTLTVFFFLGCIATTHRTVKTLAPGQGSFSASYLQAENTEDPTAEPVKFFALDARMGAARGFDLGFAHTWDLTKDNEGLFKTLWVDGRVQLNNRNNTVGIPIVTVGILKGWVYDSDADYHITGFPIMLGVLASETVVPFILYRYEFIEYENFFPTREAEGRSTFAGGVEVSLTKLKPGAWTPKLGASIGFCNSLYGGEGDNEMYYNFGFSLDGPVPSR